MTIPRTIVSIPQDAGMVQISLEVCENIEHIFLQTKNCFYLIKGKWLTPEAIFVGVAIQTFSRRNWIKYANVTYEMFSS